MPQMHYCLLDLLTWSSVLPLCYGYSLVTGRNKYIDDQNNVDDEILVQYYGHKFSDLYDVFSVHGVSYCNCMFFKKLRYI